jgi:hypothetical protein
MGQSECDSIPSNRIAAKRWEKILGGRRCRRHEFITGDFRGDADFAVLGRLDTHNLSQAADVYVARLRDLLRKSDDKFNFVANFKISGSEEIQPSVTYIARLRLQFVPFGFPRQNPHGKTHRESPSFAAFRSIRHQYPLGLLK